MVAIEVINNGLRPINIKEVGFMFSDKTKMINPREPGNLGWLKDGDGTSCYFPKSIIDEVAEEAKKRNVKVVFAYVRDSTNTYYRSKIRKHAMWFNT